MEQFFTPARRLQNGWESSPWADDPFNYTEVVALKCRPVEEFLNYDWDWDWEALLALSRGCAEQNCMDHRRHASYDRRCSPIFLDDDSSYDGLLMADFR
jgi:hypothetical protein